MTDLRERIRAAAVSAKLGSRKVWHEPQIGDFAFGKVLCFDQTLAKTGWVWLRCGDGLAILDGGVIEPDGGGYKSFEKDFYRGVLLKDEMYRLLELYAPEADAIVHEMPAVVGYRLESSRVAAHILRNAADDLGWPHKVTMVSKQRAYANLVHVYPVEKKHVTATVNALIPNWQRTLRRWTQDMHDATLLGLQWLHERKTTS